MRLGQERECGTGRVGEEMEGGGRMRLGGI